MVQAITEYKSAITFVTHLTAWCCAPCGATAHRVRLATQIVEFAKPAKFDRRCIPEPDWRQRRL